VPKAKPRRGSENTLPIPSCPTVVIGHPSSLSPDSRRRICAPSATTQGHQNALPIPSCPTVVIGHPSSFSQPIETRENRKEEVPPTPIRGQLIADRHGIKGKLPSFTEDYAEARLPTPYSVVILIPSPHCHPDPFDFAQDKGSAKDLCPKRTHVGPAKSPPSRHARHMLETVPSSRDIVSRWVR